ncbi:YncE family protein [Acidisoma cladoniae]|uniref:YncE family protein n=1 Tax=Acidisoma cladoniae TaxID=3040935 RepID=UPI00254D78B6|nr:hypothetical protein [Acidisoma sp. PAMC 29798]
MGFSPDHRTLAVVSIGSNSVSFIDTATNAVKHTNYVGRAPHEAFFTPDGKEVWITVRGENYVDVLDATTFAEKIPASNFEASIPAEWVPSASVRLGFTELTRILRGPRSLARTPVMTSTAPLVAV